MPILGLKFFKLNSRRIREFGWKSPELNDNTWFLFPAHEGAPALCFKTTHQAIMQPVLWAVHWLTRGTWSSSHLLRYVSLASPASLATGPVCFFSSLTLHLKVTIALQVASRRVLARLESWLQASLCCPIGWLPCIKGDLDFYPGISFSPALSSSAPPPSLMRSGSEGETEHRVEAVDSVGSWKHFTWILPFSVEDGDFKGSSKVCEQLIKQEKIEYRTANLWH